MNDTSGTILQHGRQNRVHNVEGTGYVDVDSARPVRRIILLHRSYWTVTPGSVDQDLYGPDFLFDCANRP